MKEKAFHIPLTTIYFDGTIYVVLRILREEHRRRQRGLFLRSFVFSGNTESSSGITSWKSSYESALYGGSKAAEAEGYAQPNGTVIVMASIDQYNVNSALDWKIYYRASDGTGKWAECKDARYA